jgi:(1->4)-alpha-D-glucan 1-alpha-D-glucosylmutase
LHDLLGIVALESQRNQCAVIGEDLGTVPDEVREALANHDVLSYRVLYFERDAQNGFRPPNDYPRKSVVTIGTHDLPPLAGYWEGDDIKQRARYGLFPTGEFEQQQIHQRSHARTMLQEALQHQQLLPQNISADTKLELDWELLYAVHRFAARSNSVIMMLQLEDLFQLVEQVNLPGDTDRGNWSHKLPLDLEDWWADERIQSLINVIRQERINALET